MKFSIQQAHELGAIIRATRKAQHMRQDDTAGSVGVSESFLGKVERGSETVQWGKLFAVMQGIGLTVHVDVPDYLRDDFNAALKAQNTHQGS